jgi:hypothetical protein
MKLAVARRGMTRRAGVAGCKGRAHTRLTEKSDQGQCSKRNLEGMDVREETWGATEMQQCHKEPMPKRAITSGKQDNTQTTFRQIIGPEIGERTVESSVSIGKKSVETFWGSRPPPKRKKRLHRA